MSNDAAQNTTHKYDSDASFHSVLQRCTHDRATQVPQTCVIARDLEAARGMFSARNFRSPLYPGCERRQPASHDASSAAPTTIIVIHHREEDACGTNI
jgi:hypothetical protein